MASGGGGNKTPKYLAWFCEVQALSLAFFSVRSIKNSIARNISLFELNEKVLRSSFKIIFGVRTARVFELKKNLPLQFTGFRTLGSSLQSCVNLFVNLNTEGYSSRYHAEC